MDQFLQAKVLKADLVSIDSQFTEKGIGDMSSMVLLKQSLISVANFVDFEVTIRRMYRDHPDLSTFYKSFSKECEFAKYLRNKFVGHLKQELINKSLEWNPEIRMFLNDMDDPNIAYVVNQLILETAINTYVDGNQKHRIFESETDLNYPPDSTRFLKFLTLIIRSSIEFLAKYLEIRQADVQVKIDKEIGMDGMLKLGIEAGKTEFSFIKK
ncbi:hypothetical protein [Vibrio scophthalmi]|uniref:HEPN AbiU2-like domain-containing protein n=1 Tax=Vibrio scophthalmi LMG 19158 TaxID=870967 RepID=F9RNV0_9VIBR|nr:hypothetical protein [Vibrio scophthalmi]EGU36777.1 hypothetical protein VIS19158_18356 [Vibrio scophthalmi LMG 19158]